MFKLTIDRGNTFERYLRSQAAEMRARNADAFKATIGWLLRKSKDSAPKFSLYKSLGGALKRSGIMSIANFNSVLLGRVQFTAAHALAVHENYGGMTIRPTRRYLYIPLSRKGYKAGQTHDYSGLKRAVKKDGKWVGDYLLTTKPVKIKPQPKAGFLDRYMGQFWRMFERNQAYAAKQPDQSE